MELYLHIPFCVKKCAYCDFLSFPADDNLREVYVEHLLREVLYYGMHCKERVSSIFIGGGTPSCLPPAQIARIMGAVRQSFRLEDGAEITMECNPGTLTADGLRVYRASGINRLSIGLQSADNRELLLLGRIHTWEEFLSSYFMARDAGFTNINIDLIASLPYQTREKFRETLVKVTALEPEHISAYSLIIEPGTPFYDRYEEDVILREQGKGTAVLPDEEEECATADMTRSLLAEMGYDRYEISNYAKKGFACRHNIGYWTGEAYLGMGLGASGYTEGIRYRNVPDMHDYLTAIEKLGKCTPEESGLYESREVLTPEAQMEEFMFLGLRMICGVSKELFRKKFGLPIEEVYGEPIRELCEAGLLAAEGDRLALTKKGMDLGNYCMAKFLLILNKE